MGSVIGKQGSKIKEIQEASGARLNASEGMLPGSTEVRFIVNHTCIYTVYLNCPQRVLSVAGVADAIHIATYYIGNILIEAQERNPGGGRDSSYRPGASGSASTTSRRPPHQGSSYVPGYSQPPGYPAAPPPGAAAGPLQTQQIYIPNDLVGCIIGKGGSKINEIRQLSASQIKIMEPGATLPGTSGPPASESERLVVITGQPANIQMAVQLLYTVSSGFASSSQIYHAHTIRFSDSNKKSRSKCSLQLAGIKHFSCIPPSPNLLTPPSCSFRFCSAYSTFFANPSCCKVLRCLFFTCLMHYVNQTLPNQAFTHHAIMMTDILANSKR